jgi:hypothetical protein
MPSFILAGIAGTIPPRATGRLSGCIRSALGMR